MPITPATAMMVSAGIGALGAGKGGGGVPATAMQADAPSGGSFSGLVQPQTSPAGFSQANPFTSSPVTPTPPAPNQLLGYGNPWQMGR